ncbi:hypothetical protein SBA2_370031 [Acidobacteriia bacterium SbA2]|nr:hypothetical protein SBA2_370031 [Acidobacteriia bacterium SbA2]
MTDFPAGCNLSFDDVSAATFLSPFAQQGSVSVGELLISDVLAIKMARWPGSSAGLLFLRTRSADRWT